MYVYIVCVCVCMYACPFILCYAVKVAANLSYKESCKMAEDLHRKKN
jgi:hypothetical protein